MSRSSSSSNRRSSESEDRTSTTSYASADVGYKGKGKARATDWDVESTLSGPARRSSLRTHPLSAPSPWVAPGAGGVGEPGPSSSSSSSRAYPLSGDQSWLDRLKSLAAPLIHGYGKGRARRLFHLVLALSIPLFGLLLANEMRISAYRTRLQRGFGPLENRTGEWEAVDPDGVALSLVDFRVGYSKKRRRELLEDRNPNGAALRLWPSPDGPEWSETDEATLSAGARQHWPAWWGSTDDVGASPYDHVPVPANGEKKRLLFLTSYKDYLERMNTHTYEIVDAALRHPGIITDVWGPGWKGYDPDQSLSFNVQRRARRIEQLEQAKAEHEAEERRKAGLREVAQKRQGSWAGGLFGLFSSALPEELEEKPYLEPDWLESYDEGCGPVKWEAVWTISDIFKQHDKHLDALACGALLVQQLGDCHEFRCFKEWYPQANNITLSKYAFELEEVFSYDRVKAAYPDWQMGIFGHNPDTGNEWDFYPLKWSDKVHDATMFGFDGSFYPIRTTITDRHRAHDHDHSVPAPLVKHHRHPGYSVSTDNSLKENPMETYEPGHWSYTNHRKLREDFAKGMREARICVFDSSLERKLIRKYAQGLLSGCVIAGDFPTEHEDALSKFMIHIHPSWKIDRIEEELRKYLDDPERLEQMALDGFIYARRYLTSTRKIDHVMSMANDYREGVRGYEYPYSFSLRCRAYWDNDRAYRPPWCEPRSMRGLET